MLQCIAQWHLEAQLSEARRVREELAAVLQDHQVAQADAFQLACAELVVNLSRYPEPKPSEIVLTLSRDQHYWWLELKDNGPSFNNFSQQILEPEALVAAESGMGLKLLAQMFPDIRYIPACYREDAYNLMLLRMPCDKEQKQPLSVLIVDDDPAYRAVLCAYLGDAYAVVEADSVTAAFDQALRYLPDVVICDIQMPGQQGTALFDQMTHVPEVADTAFIYISGCEEKAQISRALSRPIDDFLAKPVDKSQLIDALERAIQRRTYLKEQIKYELEQKVTLGLKPSLPAEILGYRLQLRSLNPKAGGGDLVQLQASGDQHLLLMADLMGHGLAAKGYAYALAGYLRGLFAAVGDQQFDLSQLFLTLSKSFDQDKVLKETLATLLAVRLSAAGDLQWVNAGQPYPILISPTQVAQMAVDGPLLGLGIEGYTPLQQRIEPGERVLIYSDGFVDAALPLPPQIIQTIEQSRNLPLAAAAEKILAARLQSAELDDDLTLILLEKV